MSEDGLITRSMRSWSAAQARWAIAAYTAVAVSSGITVGWRAGRIFDQPDAAIYQDMAAGGPGMLPFASRQLGPLVVRGLVSWLHLSIRKAYVAEGVMALVLFAVVTGFLTVRSGGPRWLVPALAGMSFWAWQFNGLVMPDLLYAALLCGFLLLLRAQQLMAAALMMFPLMVSRESTMLTLVCFLLAGWRRLRWNEVAAAVGASVAGTLLVKQLTAHAAPNFEHISPLLYLAAKMPWNFLKNVLGVGVWANLYRSCEVPKWQVGLPLGRLKAIGVCGFGSQAPIVTFSYGLAAFGLLPPMLIRLRRVRFATGGRADLLIRFALIYGVISFVLAPLLGESILRLFGYSWPLFLTGLALLVVAGRANFTSDWAAAAFVGLHLAQVWSIYWLYPRRLLIGDFVAYGLGWLLLQRTFRVPGDAVSPAQLAVAPVAV